MHHGNFFSAIEHETNTESAVPIVGSNEDVWENLFKCCCPDRYIRTVWNKENVTEARKNLLVFLSQLINEIKSHFRWSPSTVEESIVHVDFLFATTIRTFFSQLLNCYRVKKISANAVIEFMKFVELWSRLLTSEMCEDLEHGGAIPILERFQQRMKRNLAVLLLQSPVFVHASAKHGDILDGAGMLNLTQMKKVKIAEMCQNVRNRTAAQFDDLLSTFNGIRSLNKKLAKGNPAASAFAIMNSTQSVRAMGTMCFEQILKLYDTIIDARTADNMFAFVGTVVSFVLENRDAHPVQLKQKLFECDLTVLWKYAVNDLRIIQFTDSNTGGGAQSGSAITHEYDEFIGLCECDISQTTATAEVCATFSDGRQSKFRGKLAKRSVPVDFLFACLVDENNPNFATSLKHMLTTAQDIEARHISGEFLIRFFETAVYFPVDHAPPSESERHAVMECIFVAAMRSDTPLGHVLDAATGTGVEATAQQQMFEGFQLLVKSIIESGEISVTSLEAIVIGCLSNFALSKCPVEIWNLLSAILSSVAESGKITSDARSDIMSRLVSKFDMSAHSPALQAGDNTIAPSFVVICMMSKCMQNPPWAQDLAQFCNTKQLIVVFKWVLSAISDQSQVCVILHSVHAPRPFCGGVAQCPSE